MLIRVMRDALSGARVRAGMETLESLSEALDTTGDIQAIVRNE